ncbi:MAG: DUF2250 domain-containing protein [Candidatus Zixiibacteriota bacterium]
MKLKKDYRVASCCAPSPPDDIIGYYSHGNVIKIHRRDCGHVKELDPERLISVRWDDAIDDKSEFRPESDYGELQDTDFEVLRHHERYGIDYSLVVARKLNISKQEAFDRHRKLTDMRLIERVDATMVQYRKGIVDNKWIKHRNHTYYRLTDKGRKYLAHFLKNS